MTQLAIDIAGLRSGNRRALAKAITLIESKREDHRVQFTIQCVTEQCINSVATKFAWRQTDVMDHQKTDNG